MPVSNCLESPDLGKAEEELHRVAVGKRNRVVANCVAHSVSVEYPASKKYILAFAAIYFQSRVFRTYIVNLITIDASSRRYLLVWRDQF